MPIECVGGRGSAPDPAEGAHDAPPDPLIGWEGDTLSPRTLSPRRLVSSVQLPTYILAIHHLDWEQGRQWAKAGPGDRSRLIRACCVVVSNCLHVKREHWTAV